jgi:AcrR family transcriptional regulator
MPRPSRNLDRALLAAGRALYPATGCAGLTIRQVCDAAGVNTGMFNYHFGTRETFLRAVMQQAYEEMFSRFTLEVARPDAFTPAEQLRAALRVLGRFARENRKFIARLLSDVLAGEPVAREFARDNLPRHASVIAGLVAAGVAGGTFRPLAPAQAIGTCVGALVMPILGGGAIADSGALPKAASRTLADSVLSDGAIDERIDLILQALAPPAKVALRSPRKRKVTS